MAATAGFEDAQFTCEVKPKVDPSLKVPVAVNCCVLPTASDAGFGRFDVLPIEHDAFRLYLLRP